MIQKLAYFDLQELVCKDVYDFYKDTAWQFFDSRLLITIERLRERIGKPIFVNNWTEGGEFDERGFRCLKCSIVRDAVAKDKMYCSPHMRGQGVDFDVQGCVASEIREYIIKNKTLWPYPIRLENNVNWVHLDVVDNFTGEKVTLFNP